MKSNKDIQNFLTQIVHWAKNQKDISGIALVGSYARGTANLDSDIDLVILAKNHKNYLTDLTWLNQFGNCHLIKKERYGKVTSLHVQYVDSSEVEFAITTSAWSKIPPDRGTTKVVLDGIQILYDPYHLFQKLTAYVNQELPEDKLQAIMRHTKSEI